jgi:hypothetical protein
MQIRQFCFAVLMLLITFGLTQCQRDLGYIGAPDPDGPLILGSDPLKAPLQGNVLDENGLPAAEVTIAVGGQTTMTNLWGYFRINNASLDRNTSLVVAEKAGYFKAYRVFGATTGANQVTLQLIKKVAAGTISSNSGGSATLQNGARVTLPANAVVVAASGLAYSGDVQVFAAYIDPTNGDIARVVPGSFMADDKAGGRVILTSYGMMAVELESTTGVKLQVRQGSAATLAMPIPASLAGSATPTIPLWYIDEISGIWKEEGLATRQGNQYIGEVKHFSYWNCDVPGKAVSISLNLRNTSGAPLVNAEVRFRPDGIGGTAYGNSDSLGQVRGLVPASRTLFLEILDPCNSVVYTQTIPPLNVPTNLGTITVASTTASMVNFQGKIINCSNLPVKNGYAIITVNNSLRYAKTNENGEFSLTFLKCTTGAGTAQVIAVDNGLQQQGTETSINLTVPVINTGTLTACGTASDEFINYIVDGVSFRITPTIPDSLFAEIDPQNTLDISGSNSSTTFNYLHFTARNVTAATTYPVAALSLSNYRRIMLRTPFDVVLTKYAGSPGQFYEGRLSGQFTADSSATVHSLTGSFKVRRD